MHSIINDTMVRIIYGVAVSFLLCSIIIAQPSQEIEKVLVGQSEAWNRGDIEAYMEGYWKSDSLLFTSEGNVRRGWNETFEKYKKRYDSRAKMGVLKFSKLEIYQLSSESAWVFGSWELVRKQDRPCGVFTLVLRKFSNGWKIIHDHTSSEQSRK